MGPHVSRRPIDKCMAEEIHSWLILFVSSRQQFRHFFDSYVSEMDLSPQPVVCWYFCPECCLCFIAFFCFHWCGFDGKVHHGRMFAFACWNIALVTMCLNYKIMILYISSSLWLYEMVSLSLHFCIMGRLCVIRRSLYLMMEGIFVIHVSTISLHLVIFIMLSHEQVLCFTHC